MSTISAEALVIAGELRERLRQIANRYLEQQDRLPVDTPLEDIIDVLDEYDEYSYMNAFLNSIEVFPDKDYSINDTEGHIKGLRPYAFYGNTALKSLLLAGVTDLSTATSWSANCTNLQNAILPNLVTTTSYLFSNCTSLYNISIPKALALQSYAFNGCSAIKTVLSGAPNLNNNMQLGASNAIQAFIFVDQTNIATLGSSNVVNFLISIAGTSYVPSTLLLQYQSYTNWSTVNASKPIQDIESHINYLRNDLGTNFSYTPYANKKWENNQLVTDSTIGEVTDNA